MSIAPAGHLLRLVVLVLLIALPGPAVAEKRVALVIGNSAYQKAGALPNPARDAEAIAAMLKMAGFTVTRATDLGGSAMRRALRDFAGEVRDAEIAAVFYAGHGIEVNGSNFLVPVDAVLERDIDVEDEAVPLDRVSQVLEPAKRLRLIMLDACRDNPFVRGMKRTVATRSIGRGLAKVEVLSSDTLVAYAARAGSTADDGDGANSPYTSALIKHLATPGLDLRLAFGRVRDEVLKATGNRQEPFVYGSLGGAEVALVEKAGEAASPAPSMAAAPAQNAPSFEAERAWGAAKDTSSIAVLEAFAARFKDTFYADLAKARIEELKKAQVAKATPPAPALPPPTTPARPPALSSAELAGLVQGTFLLKLSKDLTLGGGPVVGSEVRDAKGVHLGTVKASILQKGITIGFLFDHNGKYVALQMLAKAVSFDNSKRLVTLDIDNARDVVNALPALEIDPSIAGADMLGIKSKSATPETPRPAPSEGSVAVPKEVFFARLGSEQWLEPKFGLVGYEIRDASDRPLGQAKVQIMDKLGVAGVIFEYEGKRVGLRARTRDTFVLHGNRAIKLDIANVTSVLRALPPYEIDESLYKTVLSTGGATDSAACKGIAETDCRSNATCEWVAAGGDRSGFCKAKPAAARVSYGCSASSAAECLALTDCMWKPPYGSTPGTCEVSRVRGK